jgi:hypothetical protein
MADALLQEDELVAIMGQTLGDAAARAVITTTMGELGIGRGALTVERALELLEALAQQPGIVGMTAMFAKSRVHLGARSKR